MKVCYLLQRQRRTGARSVGQRLGYALSEQTDHDVIMMVPSPLEIDHDQPFVMDGDVHVPTVNIFAAISIADPDIVVAHTITEELLEALPLIRSVVPTAFRFGANLAESHVNGTDEDLTRYPDFARLFDAILAPSEHAKRKAAALGIDDRRIHTVHPAVDHDARVTHDPDEAPNAVGVIARHARVKHLPFIARALRYYEDEYGDAPTVKVAGMADGSEPIHQHAAALSIAHKIESLGWVDPTEAVFPEVRAILLTSFSEHHPAVYGESLAAGVPVLAPDAAWALGPTVYDPDDPAALASELRTVLDAPGEMHALQQEAAPEGIRLEQAVEDLADALEAIVDRASVYTVGGVR